MGMASLSLDHHLDLSELRCNQGVAIEHVMLSSGGQVMDLGAGFFISLYVV